MLTRFKTNTYVDNEISRTILVLQDLEVNSEEYGEALEKLLKLQKIREEEKPSQLKSDTILNAATNLIGIVLILSYEHHHVITSKATSFVMKNK